MSALTSVDTASGAVHGGVSLVLGAMPRGAEPESHWAAGPWCFAGEEDFFPDWEDRFVFAPEPLRDLKVLERTAKEAQALCVDSLPALAALWAFPETGLAARLIGAVCVSLPLLLLSLIHI